MRFPELFIFDMDGLIFDSEQAFMDMLGATMAEYGYRLTREIYAQTLGLSQSDAVALMKSYYGEDYPGDEISGISRRRLNARVQSRPLPVKPGIPELLAWLRGRGAPRCLASSSPRTVVDTYLRSADLASLFDCVLAGDEFAHAKPDPEIFLTCCRRFGTAPEKALVFEDSENGIRAAVNGNIPVLCIPDMKRPPEEWLARAVLVAEDAGEALEYLRGLEE